ncbi:MAG: pyridoxamine 5'-phosphate oxidase family protein [Desulfosalsimonas sp.]
MRKDIKSLIRSRRQCVLATAESNQPYCSLMNYTADESCTRIYMVTSKNTRKYANLARNPKVSLLIDDRSASPPLALTVTGTFEKVIDTDEIKRVRGDLLTRNPAMKTFLDDPDAALICIRVCSVVFLDNLTRPYREAIQ